MITIGVLALQGDFAAHLRLLSELGVQAKRVTTPAALADVDALVLPGGESTVMSQLCERYGLWEALRRRLEQGLPALGTCAGMILLGRGIAGGSTTHEQRSLGAMDIDLQRNAYGAQVESFEADINAPALGPEPLRGVFIRAPRVIRCGTAVEVLAQYGASPVLVRQGPMVACSFHPEIAGETRVHRHWLRLIGAIS